MSKNVDWDEPSPIDWDEPSPIEHKPNNITKLQALALLRGFVTPIPIALHDEIATACEKHQTNVVHEIHACNKRINIRMHKKCPCFSCQKEDRIGPLDLEK